MTSERTKRKRPREKREDEKHDSEARVHVWEEYLIIELAGATTRPKEPDFANAADISPEVRFNFARPTETWNFVVAALSCP